MRLEANLKWVCGGQEGEYPPVNEIRFCNVFQGYEETFVQMVSIYQTADHLVRFGLAFRRCAVYQYPLGLMRNRLLRGSSENLRRALRPTSHVGIAAGSCREYILGLVITSAANLTVGFIAAD